MQTYNFRLTFTFISLSSLPTYNTDFSEKTKMGNICKISTYSEEWREGKVQRRKDGTGWEETTCAYLIMCLSLSKWKGINGRSFVTSQEVLVFGTFNLQCSALWKHTFVCSDSGPNSFQNKSLRKSHLSLRLNPIFRLPNTWNTWTIYDIRTHFLIQIRARFHTNPLQVARTILPSLTHTHTQLPCHNITLSAEDCFALISTLPLHHCDKGQSPNTMDASSWWPDSLPNHLTLQLIGWFNIRDV